MENSVLTSSESLSRTRGSVSNLPDTDPEVRKIQAEVQALQERIAQLEEQGRVLTRLLQSLENETRLPWWKRLFGSTR